MSIPRSTSCIKPISQASMVSHQYTSAEAVLQLDHWWQTVAGRDIGAS